MDAPLADLARRFRFNERLLALEVDGFDGEDWSAPAGARGGNCAQWILAHVLRSRHQLLRALGEATAEAPWEARVAAGVRSPTLAGLPPPAELVAAFGAAGERLGERLVGTTPEGAARPWGRTFPDGGTTLADGARFLHFHETYHLGQVGLLRRIRGKAGFV